MDDEMRDILLSEVSGMNRPIQHRPAVATAWPQTMRVTAPDDEDFSFTPQMVKAGLDRAVIGQEAAKRAASMILYSTSEYGVSNSLFIGQTGCGKTEIWRQLAGEYPGMIQIADASQITAEGWRGGVKLSTLLKNFRTEPRYIRYILVLDEFDKIFDQKNSDTNYFDLIQDQMLKLFDHDPGLVEEGVGPQEVSVVCLGAFASIYAQKGRKKHSLGFNSEAEEETPHHITAEDLKAFGLKPELIGRFSRIVEMEPPSLETYRRIADMEVSKLKQRIGKQVTVAPALLDKLTVESLDAGLGARYVKNELLRMAEDYIFDHPHDREIALTERSPAMC